MTRSEAILKLNTEYKQSEEIQLAIDSLKAWDSVISDLKHKVEFARSASAKDYAIGIDTALFVVRNYLKDSEIVE